MLNERHYLQGIPNRPSLHNVIYRTCDLILEIPLLIRLIKEQKSCLPHNSFFFSYLDKSAQLITKDNKI